MLEIGSTATDLDLEDTSGDQIRLGGRHALLYFMRSTTCPVCNGHVRDLAKRADLFAAADVRVLIAVPEGRGEAAAWRARRGVPFEVVTGRSGTPHESVGLVRKVFGAMQQSGSILLDRGGAVRHAHAATMPTAGYDRKGILAAVGSLQRNDKRDSGRA
ncbi:peroxiredoxin family protein [Glycomyces paridis]|uniref:Redoxin domain-containing protein n=1 Tax=Glycomyces paridis TaxID=2126555 RepID=A0A4S8PDC5_9ACTN|nr:redoxin domain-containing protein [Glycomyces paridis]THV28367.1 redoxin domain-containing protein [Glycomyces paridis]